MSSRRVEQVDDAVHPKVQGGHLLEERSPRLIAGGDDALVGIPIGGIDGGVVGIVVRVAVPMPADAVP